MYSYRCTVYHSYWLFEVSSICLPTFSDSCDHRTCHLTKHFSVVNASCSAENLLQFFSRVPLVCIHQIIYNLRTEAFKAYCAIWVRRSNFRHQVSLCVSPRESTQRRKVELWARNVRKFCLNARYI